MYSDFVDVVHENYRGAGLEYNWEWLTVEMIGGAPEIDEKSEETRALTAPNELTFTTTEVEARRLIGGRVKVRTPLPGLGLMLSASRFNEELETSQQVLDILAGTTTTNRSRIEGVEKLWIGSLEYDDHDLELKAEYARKNGLDEKIITYYGEAGYTFFESLTPYVRYDYIATNVYERSNPANHQADTTVGIGYKINDYIKVKVENHFIKGYALVLAERGGDVDMELEPIKVADRWNMFVAGVNFMF